MRYFFITSLLVAASVLTPLPAAQIHDADVRGDITAIKAQLEEGLIIELPVAKDEPKEGFTPLALAITELQYDAMVFLSNTEQT